MKGPFASNARSPVRAIASTHRGARPRGVQARAAALGFSLDSELCISDVEVGTWPGCEWSDRVCGEIGAAIDELVARIEDEGASELLRGRTFRARAALGACPLGGETPESGSCSRARIGA